MGTITGRLLEAGFGRPQGLLGHLGGMLMAYGNAATEQHMVNIAELSPTETVLVLGPGPGIGLQVAGQRAARAIGVDPSEVMLRACRRRCADLVAQDRVRLVTGTAEHTAQPDSSIDVAIAVNNVQIWPDWAAGFTELRRVLRPGGRLLLSAHQKWLPGGPDALARAVGNAGFCTVRSWTWQPPGRGATTATQLSANQPND